MEKYVIVTGADRGLGRALVEGLLERDYVVFAGQFMPEIDELAKLKEKFGEKLHIIPLNVGDDESVKKACEIVKNSCPQLNLILNNAGITDGEKVDLGGEIEYSKLLNTINVNSLGHLRIINGLIDHLLKSDEKLIANISSEAGSITKCFRKNQYGYVMSKAAVNALAAVVHNAIKEKGGKVMLLHPGHVRSYMNGEFNTKGNVTAEDSAQKLLKLILDCEIPETERPTYQDLNGVQFPW